MLNKEKVVLRLWAGVVIVFVTFYVCQLLVNTIMVFKTSGGAEISLDGAGIPEIVLICAVYYLSKYLLTKE